ncbi:hypothetical protein SEA_WYBORN_42 [Arthrobacter phage Wyborn]|uniref:Uncharacterized protein n=1 Tax=Arthrobacter phage Wyborn TaxID=3059067 RepID=A0AA96GUH8_9CAUD|nr:hypothetical protein SEA_WYBORN_42 [Arthrobacter phage Wyborn]
MKHKLTRSDAIALTKLVTSLQPGWQAEDFLTKLAEHREQQHMGDFVKQLVEGALAGEMIDDALRPVQPHVCQSVVQQTSQQIDEHEAWLNSPAASVVNEDDPTKSVLLRKRKPEQEIVRPPSEDPNHWRNRFAADIEAGKQAREELLMQNRAAAPQEQTPEPSFVEYSAGSAEPVAHYGDPSTTIAHHDLPAPSVEQSATAAGDVQQGVPAASPSSPASQETAPGDTNERRFEDLDPDHKKMLLAAQRKREQQQSGYSGRNAGWNDHNPDR